MQAYLDNSATTKCAPEVVDVCVKVMSKIMAIHHQSI